MIEVDLPNALTIGLTEKEFWECTPRRYKAYIKAAEQKRKLRDHEDWLLGVYFMSALSKTLDEAFNGRKARSKYLETPILSKDINKKKWIDGSKWSEEKKQKALEQLVGNINAMESNFHALHGEQR